MIQETARIAELEKKLGEVVRYLRALPVHPATYRMANDAEAVLNSQVVPTAMAGCRIAPSGILMLAAKASGSRVTLKTMVPCVASMEQWHRNEVYGALLRGCEFSLEEMPETGLLSDAFFAIEKRGEFGSMSDSHDYF